MAKDKNLLEGVELLGFSRPESAADKSTRTIRAKVGPKPMDTSRSVKAKIGSKGNAPQKTVTPKVGFKPTQTRR